MLSYKIIRPILILRLIMIKFYVQADSAFVVLYAWNSANNEYQVLIGHDRFLDRDYWNLLGGAVDYNETPAQAACREVYEESVRWYGSDPKNNLKGKYCPFSPSDLKDYFCFKTYYKGKTDQHHLYFKEVNYIDPQRITDSLAQEID